MRIPWYLTLIFIIFSIVAGLVHPNITSAAGGILFNQPDDSAISQWSWYSDNWYQLGRGFAGTITSLTLEGMVNDSVYGASSISLKEFSDENYSQLVNTYTISDDAPFTADGLTKATFSDLDIPLDPNHYYRLDTTQGRQNVSVILAGTPGIGTAMADQFVYGVGRVEADYAFYPYILVTGSFNEPLVIVPGIMGSELDGASQSSAPGKEYWPDVTDMANSGDDSYLDALKLAPDGTQISGNEMTAGDIIRSATGTYNRLIIPIPIDDPVYGNLIKTFTDIGYVEGQTLFVAPYDWRLDVASSAVAVGAVIQKALTASPTGKINIIAHSMGGLAVKAYLAGLSGTSTGTNTSASTSASFIDKLIFSGVPQLGAPYVFKALQYGDNLGFTVGPFDLLNPDEVKSITQNMPGVYDLLPSRRFVSIDGGYILRDVTDDAGNVSTAPLDFDETNELLTENPGDARNAGLLSRADAFHGGLDDVSLGPSQIFNIVGCQDPTPEQYILHEDGSIDINRANGDGSVPVDSAMNLANGYQNYFVLNSENGVDHEGLIRDAQPLALMQAIIQGTTSSLALEPLGISTATEDCVEGRGAVRPAAIEVSASGSSTIDVYDANGDHVGVNGAGDVDLQIPGSSYDTIGGNTFVTLPASTSAYKVTVKAAKKSTVKVKTYDTSTKVTTTTAYTDVPLDSASSTATLLLAENSSTAFTASLTVDESGAGATGTPIEPDGAEVPEHVAPACMRM